MENKEYCIFANDGSFVFTSSAKPTNYIEDPNFTVIYHEKLDFNYSHSLVDGQIIKGELYPSAQDE